MEPLIDRARAFPQRAGRSGRELDGLATGQSPQALFITCSDSRVVPALITGADPGDLFELRTAGNIVPPYRADSAAGETATIEYAVEVLGVRDVVVCGHSHCGAVGAVVRGEDLSVTPAVRSWLRNADRGTLLADGTDVFDPTVAGPVQRHVLAQLDQLRGYPGIAGRLLDGRVRLHGWFYEVHTGLVLAHRADSGLFLPL
ncbi:carbonic anhydrase [Kitasatospora herbaricolor]|uniref:carbonic anhydrase n=1 Tax=Kitasatospora herbaricolor TaxID=68217 RepID=UPI00174D195F|nr:carbonic anhydrase [Kitasatospora herbaricolor]MDQ0305686.1 carbonic anhydrase [Kitasatospora herbaricolor]GGV27432.1 carbonic anhydrase [Kitasatospora herbaricolor]